MRGTPGSTWRNVARHTALLCMVGLFVASLGQDAYCTPGCVGGREALLVGWLGVLLDSGAIANALLAVPQVHTLALPAGTGAAFAWLANPLFIAAAACLYGRMRAGSILASAVALLFAASFGFFKQVLVDEAGHYARVSALGPGYWLWTLSCLGLLLAAVFLSEKSKEPVEAL